MNISDARNIAIFRTDRLGDMILTLPLALAIKNELPNSKVTMIAQSYCAPLLENCSALDDLIYIDLLENKAELKGKLKSHDAAFFPRPKPEEAFIAFRAGIKLRIGSGYRAYSILFNHRVYDHRKSAKFHEAEYNARLLESALGRKVKTELAKPFISVDSLEKASHLLNNSGIKSGDFFIVHPGSRGSAFDWRSENFGAAANLISLKTGLTAVITGTEPEAAQCGKVLEQCPRAVNLCGKLELREMLALISLARLFAANSTGTLHIAAALGIPALGLYPNTPHISAKRWGPYSKNSITISPPIMEGKNIDDMNGIEVSEFVEAGMRLLA